MINLMTIFTKSIFSTVMSFHIYKLIPQEITKYLQLLGNNTFKTNELDYKKKYNSNYSLFSVVSAFGRGGRVAPGGGGQGLRDRGAVGR